MAERKRKCFCGREGMVRSLNGYSVVICHDHYGKWRFFNGWALPKEIRHFQEKFEESIEEIGKVWYEGTVETYEKGEED